MCSFNKKWKTFSSFRPSNHFLSPNSTLHFITPLSCYKLLLGESQTHDVPYQCFFQTASTFSCWSGVWHLGQPIGFWTCLCSPNIPLSVGVGSHASYFPVLLTPSCLFITACLSACFLFLKLIQHHQWCFNRAYESWNAFICNPGILSSEYCLKIIYGN